MISVQYSVKMKTILNRKTTFQQTKEHQKGALIGSSFIQFIVNNPISSISSLSKIYFSRFIL
jgi:hypothetical protein